MHKTVYIYMIEIKPKSALEQPIYMLTKASTCPYLKGHVEKRIATDISFNEEIYDVVEEVEVSEVTEEEYTTTVTQSPAVAASTGTATAIRTREVN